MGEGGEMKEKSAVGAGEGGLVTVSLLCTSAKVPSTMTISAPEVVVVRPPSRAFLVFDPLRTAPRSLLIFGVRG